MVVVVAVVDDVDISMSLVRGAVKGEDSPDRPVPRWEFWRSGLDPGGCLA